MARNFWQTTVVMTEGACAGKDFSSLVPLAARLVLGLAACSCRAADIPVTIYADAGYPPYAYEENGEVRGIYTEILRTAFARMSGYRVTIKAEPWKRIVAQVASGHYFAFYPPYYRPQERPDVAPYSVPILNESIQLLCSFASKPRKSGSVFPDDYLGMRILRNSGFIVGDVTLQQAVARGKVQLNEAADTPNALRMIAAGRADCYVGDPVAVKYEIARLQIMSSDRRLLQLEHGAVLANESGFVGYARKAAAFPFKPDFVAKLDRELEKMQRSGEIAAIQRRHLALP